MPEPEQVAAAMLSLPKIGENNFKNGDGGGGSSLSSSHDPPSSKAMEARDSISSIDSDVSLSFDCAAPAESARPSEEADLSSDSASEDTGGKDSGCEVTPDIAEEPIFTPPSDELADKIVQQVEFYFSDANITKDAFLLKHVKRNKEGYVSLKLISSFKRVKHITKDWRVVAHALARSAKLETNEAGTKLRRVHALPRYDETAPSRTVVAVNMPIERPTIEDVAELFRNCGEIALIRILRPGNPIPADVRQFINKNPSLGGTVCALVEFVQSEAARAAVKLTRNQPAELKVYELNCVPHPERKKKVASSSNSSSSSSSRNTRHHSVDDSTTSDYTSCSEADAPPRRRGSLFNRCAAVAEPAAWLQRRLSASSTEACFRRLSYYSSSSRDSSDSNLFVPRRVSTACNLLLDAAHCCQPTVAPHAQYYQYLPHHPVIVQHHQQHPQFNAYYQRRFSACSSSSGDGSAAPVSGGRSRSNSSANFQAAENVVRLPRGPDGSRGFQGRVRCE